MPFRDELQAAYDKIAALEQRLQEREREVNDSAPFELKAELRKERHQAAQDKLLREALDARNKAIQDTLEAKVKILEDSAKRAYSNAEQIQQRAYSELETLAGLSRAEASSSFLSQLRLLTLQIKQQEALLSLPLPPTNDFEALREVEEDILAAMRKREEHLSRMCAILNQPPKE